MREKLGPWGDEVNDAGLAYALLGLGLLPSRLYRRPNAALQALAATLEEDKGLAYRWRLDMMPSTPKAWSQLPSAESLANVVRDFAAPRPLRFALLPGSVLSTVNVWSFVSYTLAPQEAASHIACKPSLRKLRMRWPLRIGFPPGPDAEAHIEQMLTRDSWGGNVYEPFVLSRRKSESDLLVCLERGNESANSMLRRASRDVGTIRADVVAVFSSKPAAGEQFLSVLEDAREVADAGGIAHFDQAVGEPVELLRAICIEISHNLTFDAAVAAASRGRGLLMASRELLDKSRIEFKAIELAEALTTSVQAGVALGESDTSQWAEIARRAPALARARVATRAHMGRYLESSVRDFGWHAESAEASELGRVMRSLAEEDANQSKPRYLQAGFASTERPDAPLESALKPASAYFVNVFIGAQRRGYAGAHAPFPDLPPREDGRSHELDVVFWEPRLCSKPKVEKMSLPPLGSTLPVRFPLKTRQGTKAINARISVVHLNRVLQTGTLKAPVGSQGPVEFELDAIPRRVLSGLDERTNFSLAIVLNDTEGEGAVHVMANGKAQTFKIDDPAVADLVTAIGAAITDITNDPGSYKGIHAPGSQALLLELAARGADMRQYLERYAVESGNLLTPEFVQVVATKPGKVFPLEYVYDWTAPDDDAQVCPHAVEALTAGECTADCPRHVHPEQMEKTVCPFGFWGVRCVIERRLHDNKKAATAEPSGTRRVVLKPLSSILVGATARADAVEPTSVSGMLDRIRKLDPKCQRVTQWSSWPDGVVASKPTTLALVVHQQKDAHGSPLIEIGPPPLLKSQFLKVKHVRVPDSDVFPLVLLIGCETSVASISYESFAVRFQWHGAAHVVSTIAEVVGRQAAPMTADILEVIQSVREPSSFSLVMREVRRRLLAAGTPLVLGLVSEGDADWEVVGN